MPERPTRFLLSGLGRRAWTTYLPKLAECRPERRLVAVNDPDPARLDEFRACWPEPVLMGEEFDAVLARAQPNWVIVASPDNAHAGQIVAGLAAEASVLVEKPMVLSASEARHVLDAEQRSSSEVSVAHNLRYLNLHVTIKRLLLSDRIGRVTQVNFWYHLKPGHGQSYFLRWHRRSIWSGGLQITKGCHHFDLLNWWLIDQPVQVFARSARNHFLPGGEIPADADIADTISALIQYRRGAVVSYMLSARSPWEGYELRIHGTKGRLAFMCQMAPATGETLPSSFVIEVTPHDGPSSFVKVPCEPGRHGGADGHMLTAMFDRRFKSTDPLGQAATALDGAYAIALGEAVTRSVAEGHDVLVSEFPGGKHR